VTTLISKPNIERLLSSARKSRERHVLHQPRQEPGEDVDSFVLRLRKQARHCGYGEVELEFAVRDQLLEKISSLELRTKLFEELSIQLAAAIDKARAWNLARRQASSIAEGEGGQSNVNMVKDRDSKKPLSGFGKHKCYVCAKVGHIAVDKMRPARGKTCVKCGDKGHWAACSRSEIERKKCSRVRDGRARGDKQRPSRDAKHDPKSGNSIVDRFPKVFSGVGNFSGNQLKLLIDPKVRPVAQKT